MNVSPRVPAVSGKVLAISISSCFVCAFSLRLDLSATPVRSGLAIASREMMCD